jgi:hypothetical protein
MRWVGYVVHKGERGVAYRILIGKLKEQDYFEYWV